jgi:hypothetical protein
VTIDANRPWPNVIITIRQDRRDGILMCQTSPCHQPSFLLTQFSERNVEISTWLGMDFRPHLTNTVRKSRFVASQQRRSYVLVVSISH